MLLIGHLKDEADRQGASFTPRLPISSCQQHSAHVMKVHEGVVWCMTPRPYRKPMENTWWPGCEGITGRWTTEGFSERLKEGEEEEEKREWGRWWGGVCKTPSPKGQSSPSLRSLGGKKKRNRRLFSFWKVEEGNSPTAIQVEIPTNSTNHPSDQSVCAWVCVRRELHLRTEVRKRGLKVQRNAGIKNNWEIRHCNVAAQQNRQTNRFSFHIRGYSAVLLQQAVIQYLCSIIT